MSPFVFCIFINQGLTLRATTPAFSTLLVTFADFFNSYFFSFLFSTILVSASRVLLSLFLCAIISRVNIIILVVIFSVVPSG